jgi:phosphatidate cytidylyltransferase
MINAKQSYPILWLSIACSAFILINYQLRLNSLSQIQSPDLILFMILLFTSIELFRVQGSPTLNLGGTLLSLLYITLPCAVMLDMRLYDSDGYFVAMIFISVWMSDTFAYFGGRFFGEKFIRIKFSERYSPKKTWEGYFSGCIAGVISAYCFSQTLLPQFQTIHLLFLGLLIGALSPIGDLIESMFKRDSGVKDSGFLPGHGGFFDRFDSLCFIAPVIYLFSKYFMRLG